MACFETFLLDASKYGIWDIISVVVLLFSIVMAIRYLLFPLYKVTHLNFHVTHTRDNTEYPSKLNFEIRNFTNKSIVLSNTYFKPNRLKPDPNGRGDTALNRIEIKFPPNWNSMDCFLIHGQIISTWFPIDPNQTNDEIQVILNDKTAGGFYCKCTFITKKPWTVKLIRKY